MKIENIQGVYELYKNSVRAVEPKKKVEAPKDEINLSRSAQDYQFASKAVRNAPDVRDDIVTDVSSRAKSGGLNIPSGAIADKLVAAFF